MGGMIAEKEAKLQSPGFGSIEQNTELYVLL